MQKIQILASLAGVGRTGWQCTRGKRANVLNLQVTLLYINFQRFFSKFGLSENYKIKFRIAKEPKFSHQRDLLHTHTIFGIFSVHWCKNLQKIPILTVLNLWLICPMFSGDPISSRRGSVHYSRILTSLVFSIGHLADWRPVADFWYHLDVNFKNWNFRKNEFGWYLDLKFEWFITAAALQRFCSSGATDLKKIFFR